MSQTSSTTQYNLDISSAGEQEIIRYSRDWNEPPWLLEHRLKAFETFRRIEPEASPLFRKYVDLGGVVLDEYEYLSGDSGVLDLNEPGMAEGVIVEDFHKALQSHGELLKRAFLAKAVKSESDKFAALANAVFNSGVFVYIPRDIHIDSPIGVKLVLPGGHNALVHQSIVLGDENSGFSIVEDNSSSAQGGLYLGVTDVQLLEGSQGLYSNINTLSESASVFTNRKVIAHKDSHMGWTLAHLGGKVVRGRLESIMNGQGSSSDDIEVVFGDKEQRFDLVSDISFLAPQSTGAVFSKAVLKDSSKSVMKGTMGIRSGAKNSRAYLSIHAMLLSKQANAEAIPTLEIDTNEVKATHSAAVEQVDEEQMFYLLSRGIDYGVARRLMMLAFFEKAVERIPSRELRTTLRKALQQKWDGSVSSDRDSSEDVFESALEFASSPRGQTDIFEGHYKYRTTTESQPN
ncbi:MAG: SufD family Fe-S cluster assembly protein [Candidatus Marsarchaeota archaeon]|nr:SufD family Fe-S cluster assembly protein [Candidatus Marsarchaeota archaeon]